MPAEWINRCHFGDVRAVLQRMAADGVQVNTIVTSPPYFGLRSYLPDGHPDKASEIGGEPTIAEFIATMVEVFDLCRQVLRDDGTLWLNLGDSYAANRGYQVPSTKGGPKHSVSQAADGKGSTVPDGLKAKDLIGIPWRVAFALQAEGWYLRQDIVWHKPNPMPESVRDRCTKAHEYVFLLSKSERYFYDFEAAQEPVSGAFNPHSSTIKMPDGWDTGVGGHGSFHRNGREKGVTRRLAGNVNPPKGQAAFEAGDQRHRTKAGLLAYAQRERKLDEALLSEVRGTRNRRSVWTVPSEPYGGAHFATFPRALIEPCILAGCPVGGVVLDPFFGSGTTGQVAQALGRRFIGIELNADYRALQDERLRQPSLMLEVA